MCLFAGDYYVFVHGICPPLGFKASYRVPFTFDPYPRESRVQDLNLFKSDFGSENACVKDKMRTFQCSQAASLCSADSKCAYILHKPNELTLVRVSSLWWGVVG